jgi:hypothetical protein
MKDILPFYTIMGQPNLIGAPLRARRESDGSKDEV